MLGDPGQAFATPWLPATSKVFMNANVIEIAPKFYRISTFIPEADLQFNQFVIDDDEPLLFHTGLRRMFPLVRDAVASVMDPSRLRWISFSHFEADECGSLNEWLHLAPQASPACSITGAIVSVDDFADRPARQLGDCDVLDTGAHRFRFLKTPHLPHAWEAGLLFEETTATLLCSDLLHQNGDREAVTQDSVTARTRDVLQTYKQGPLDNYVPYTPLTAALIERLAALEPRCCATMHGSAFMGDGGKALREFGQLLREMYAGDPRQ